MLTDAKIAAIKPPPSGQDEHPDHKVTGLRLRVGAGGKKSWIVRRRVGAKVKREADASEKVLRRNDPLAVVVLSWTTRVLSHDEASPSGAREIYFGFSGVAHSPFWVDHAVKQEGDARSIQRRH